MKPPECHYEKTEMDLAKAGEIDVGFEDHGFFTLFGGMNYDCGSQGFGWIIDLTFIKRFIKVFGVHQLQNSNGKLCWVEHSNQKIFRLIPLGFDGDECKEFDIEDWSQQKRKESEKRAKRKS